MIKIVIPEDIPSDNKGEAALFYGIVKSLSIFGSSQISLFSMHPEKDAESYKGLASIVDARGITPSHTLDGAGNFLSKLINYSKFLAKICSFGFLHTITGKSCLSLFKGDIWKICLDADLVIMCHDSFYAPLYHGPLILLFKALGKTVILYGSTIVPPGKTSRKTVIKTRNLLNRLFLGKADLITLREKFSFNYLKRLGVSNIAVYPDFAFITDTAPEDKVVEILRREKIDMGGPVCGFAFSQKEIDHAFMELPVSERREKALEALAKVMDHITGPLGMMAIFIPHAIGPTDRVDDRIAADWIKDRCRNKDKIHIIRNDYSQAQLKGIARILTITIGTRLHFTIDALCHCVPSILITHIGEYRCHGIVGAMIGQEKYVYNIDKIQQQELLETVDDLWRCRESVRNELKKKMPEIIKETMMHAIQAKKIYISKKSR